MDIKVYRAFSKLLLEKNAKDSVLNPDDKLRIQSRSKFHHALNKGLISKPNSCQKCGRIKSNLYGHHEDYSKPLKVIWLCSACHRILHNSFSPIIPYPIADPDIFETDSDRAYEYRNTKRDLKCRLNCRPTLHPQNV